MLRQLSRLLLPKASSLATSRAYAAAETKSMLGGSTGAASTTNILEHAAEARMQNIKRKMDAPDEERSLTRRVVGYVANFIVLATLGGGALATFASYRYTISELEEELEKAKSKQDSSGTGLSGMWVRGLARYLEIRKGAELKMKEFTDPTYHRLLPDMAPELKGRIKTLVLDLEDVLIHKEWTRQKGWTIYKRPGVQDFILEMGQFYEMVVFADEPSTYVDPIINRLDVHRVIPYRLYRPETQYHKGKHVRDLSKLNRDLSQVLFISSNPDAYEFQPENTIKLKPWKNDPKDTTLLDLIPFLQLIATRGVRDTREVVQSYDGEPDIPHAFKARMQQIADHQKQQKARGFFGLGTAAHH